MTTKIETMVGNEIVTVRRLDDAAELEAKQDAIWDRYGHDVSDDDFDACMGACRVCYRDNYDTGESEYTVDDDAGGYSIGWTPVA